MHIAAFYSPAKRNELLVKVRASCYQEADQTRRMVGGSRYSKGDSNPEDTMWAFRYPLTVDKCHEMREAWGTAVKVHTGLSEWYRASKGVRAEQVARTTLTDASLPRLSAAYPAFNDWLKGDQRVTAAWMAHAYRGAGVLADEVGTGKTAGVIAGLIEANITGPVLVVCPKISVKSVWYKEFTRHTPDVPVYLCRGTRKNREKNIAAFMADARPMKVLVVVSEMLRIKALRHAGRIVQFLGYEYPAFYEIDWAGVVVDESHKLLGAMDVVRGNLAGEGLRALTYAPNALRLAVSATPFGKGGRVEALFGTLHWLWPDEYTSRWQWLEKNFEVDEEKIFVKGGRGATKTVKKVGGLRTGTTEQQFWDSLGPRILRRRMEDVSPEHKGLKNYVEVMCEMEARQALQYKVFAEDAELAVQGGIISSIGVLDFLTRSRQFANGFLRKEGGRVVYTDDSCKIDKLMAHLDNLEPGRKVVVSSQYNEFLDAVERRFAKDGYRWYRLDGKTSETQREAMMGEFQGGEYRGLTAQGPLTKFTGPGVTCSGCNVSYGRNHGQRCPANHPNIFLLNSQAGGVSITLDAAEEMHQLDEMYPPEANTQLYGRIFRRGRVHEVFFYLYRTIGTIDEKIGYNVGEGHAAQLRVLDGRRGLEYARTLAKYGEE